MTMRDMLDNAAGDVPVVPSFHYEILDKVEWAIMSDADIYQDILSDAIQDDDVSMALRIALFHGKPDEAGRALERYVTNHLYNHYSKEIDDEWTTYTNYYNSPRVDID